MAHLTVDLTASDDDDDDDKGNEEIQITPLPVLPSALALAAPVTLDSFLEAARQEAGFAQYEAQAVQDGEKKQWEKAQRDGELAQRQVYEARAQQLIRDDQLRQREDYQNTVQHLYQQQLAQLPESPAYPDFRMHVEAEGGGVNVVPVSSTQDSGAMDKSLVKLM